jgi:methylmalonyl-CoA mutase
VNQYRCEKEDPLQILDVDPNGLQATIGTLDRIKATRDTEKFKIH